MNREAGRQLGTLLRACIYSRRTRPAFLIWGSSGWNLITLRRYSLIMEGGILYIGQEATVGMLKIGSGRNSLVVLTSLGCTTASCSCGILDWRDWTSAEITRTSRARALARLISSEAGFFLHGEHAQTRRNNHFDAGIKCFGKVSLGGSSSSTSARTSSRRGAPGWLTVSGQRDVDFAWILEVRY